MKKFKTAFITFFPVIPDNMGSSAVINSRFKSWPYQKKIFQLSHVKNLNNKNLKTVFIKKENPLSKIIYLPKLINEVLKYLRNIKKKVIIIEGASWIFYSFVVLTSFKILLPESKIIYISHSIESEIRKKYSNLFIFFLTKYLEKLVFKYSDIATSVSKIEKIKIKKFYNQKTILYPNALTINYKNKKKIFLNNYIIYSGSCFYKPNRVAVEYLNNKIMPNLMNNFPNLKLVLTGGGFNKKYPWLINKGIVSKKDLYNLIFFSKCMCVPLKFGSGTRIKIIEALSIGAIVLSTNKGIEGIELKKINPPFIFNNSKKLLKLITYVLKNNNKIKKISVKNRSFYMKKYSMESITKDFFKKYFKDLFNNNI